MSKILVTGGAGFIGSHLVDALIARKNQVVVVDDLSVGKKANVNQKAQFYKVDITKPSIETIFQKNKFDYVFHLAAQKNLQVSKQLPVHDAMVNVLGSVRIFQLAKKFKTKKVVFYSTAAVYDPNITPPNIEDKNIGPSTPYGIAKYASELYLKNSGIPYAILRLSNVYGPRQDAFGEGGVVAIFAHQLVRRHASTIFNTGRQTRDFIFVDDVVQASIKSLNITQSFYANISTGHEMRIVDLYRTMARLAGVKMKVVHRTVAEQYRSALRNTKAQRILRWHPEVNALHGLTVTYNWFSQTYGKA